ncbi:protein of unknown function [Taphrina deformans PYCC 5710]|uniref:Protein BIG1 n=1 Tax=Taphrina deformans (strain PYCC 5710 / ATCC 11124 / CBS 356.35 / IMI 108563 / JCM 9778 / NBRC 8474) TaxID=1097556 RepID=R4X8L2_TAPDE|nr:protein of unknown function [Taphrina deformans PYCC 5710]|eukprot:CCG81964.1 protein of unknown function [Taphrina deformans PYCC 5710]
MRLAALLWCAPLACSGAQPISHGKTVQIDLRLVVDVLAVIIDTHNGTTMRPPVQYHRVEYFIQNWKDRSSLQRIEDEEEEAGSAIMENLKQDLIPGVCSIVLDEGRASGEYSTTQLEGFEDVSMTLLASSRLPQRVLSDNIFSLISMKSRSYRCKAYFAEMERTFNARAVHYPESITQADRDDVLSGMSANNHLQKPIKLRDDTLHSRDSVELGVQQEINFWMLFSLAVLSIGVIKIVILLTGILGSGCLEPSQSSTTDRDCEAAEDEETKRARKTFEKEPHYNMLSSPDCSI